MVVVELIKTLHFIFLTIEFSKIFKVCFLFLQTEHHLLSAINLLLADFGGAYRRSVGKKNSI